MTGVADAAQNGGIEPVVGILFRQRADRFGTAPFRLGTFACNGGAGAVTDDFAFRKDDRFPCRVVTPLHSDALPEGKTPLRCDGNRRLRRRNHRSGKKKDNDSAETKFHFWTP